MDYRIWALLSAVFAGATAVLAKRGVEGVPSNLALAVRVVVVLLFSVAIAVAKKETAVHELTGQNWTFLVLSGFATGLSWLCYFRALQLGPVSKVAPIDKLSFVLAAALGIALLHEKVSWSLVGGCALIVAGVLVTLR